MAEKHSSTASLFLVRPAAEPPKIPTNSIAIEALAIARECVEALQHYHAETEIRLEMAAIRAIRNGDAR
jgi:hypothetical protein